MEKVLVLGGKPIGSVEITQRLKERGYYVIVTDYLPPSESPAKRIADEYWDISTADVEELAKKIKLHNIKGIITGVHEFNIRRLLDLAELTGLPAYCTRESWKYCANKQDFKKLCKSYIIPVAKVFTKEQIENEDESVFPVIVKPVDGSGSRGFHICNNIEEFQTYYEKAKHFSFSGNVLIEEYVPYDAVIIHYTMDNGKCYYSGMSDKVSVRFNNSGASVMGLQTFPSIGETTYLGTLDAKVRKMFEEAGFKNGPIWIEAFYNQKDKFIFNEMGYRFGGSLTYYPVEYFTGINQLDRLIDNSMGKSSIVEPHKNDKDLKYAILPVHIYAGKITSVEINDDFRNNEKIHAIVPVHFIGDIIQDWGSAQQVYAYIHILYSDKEDLISQVNSLLDNLIVKDEDGKNMLHTLFDINSLRNEDNIS